MKFVFPFQADLQDGMGARGVIVGAVLGGDSGRHPERDVLH